MHTTDPLDAGHAHLARGDFAAALACFEPASAAYRQAADPRLVWALAGAAWALCRAGNPTAGLARHAEALTEQHRLDPGDENALAVLRRGRAMALTDAGAHAQALADFDYVTDVERRGGADPERRLKTLEAAVAAAGAAAAWPAALAWQRELIALLERQRGPTARALAPALVTAAFLAHRVHRPAEVEASLRAAIAIDPALKLARTTLIDHLFRQGRDAEATALGHDTYRASPLTTERPGEPGAGTVLLLRALRGNVPERHLLARLPLTEITWQIAYAAEAAAGPPPVPCDLVINLVGDADAGAEALERAAAFAPHCPVPLLNHPDRIRRTARHQIPSLLAGIEGLLVPRAVRLPAAALRKDVPATLARHRLRLPVILRAAGRHGGETARLCDTEACLHAAAAPLADPDLVYLTEFHDYVSADGYFRKYRAIFVDRRVHPYHLAISPGWLVHYFSADMEEHAWKHEEELRFLHHPDRAIGAPALRVLAEIAARLDLDYAGADFALLPDGRVLLFEANGTMLVHPEDPSGPLARKNPFVETILSAFDAMLAARLARQLPAHPAAPPGTICPAP